MDYIIVAFRSRAETLKFVEILRGYSIRADVVNTPKEASVGCGLSVKVFRGLFEITKKILFSLNLNSFAGFFLVTERGSKRIVRAL